MQIIVIRTNHIEFDKFISILNHFRAKSDDVNSQNSCDFIFLMIQLLI